MARGQEKVVVPKQDLPPVTLLSDGTYGYIMRYRIVSEDQNRFSHWSPIRELSIPYPVFADGGISITGNLAQSVWTTTENEASGYDIFLNLGFRMIEKNIVNNKATISILGNHKFSVGDTVLISGDENPSDVIDSSFSPNPNSTVSAIAALENGQYFIGGSFTEVDGTLRVRLARINFDGTLDSNFGLPLDETVSAIRIQDDGKIVFCGFFNTVGGSNVKYIARANPNGSLDSSFLPSFNLSVSDVAIQNDGKIIAVGDFTTVNGSSVNYITRLNSDGSIDSSFSASANDYIGKVLVQQDGKILIAGTFTEINGVSRTRVARLNEDGSLDTGFNPTIDGTPRSICLQNDGKILVGGIVLLNSPSINGLLRLNSDGSLDTDFGSSSNVNGEVFAIALQPDNKIVIGGFFANVGSDLRWRVAKLNSNGTLDESFNANLSSADSVSSLAIDYDGNILIGGQFSSISGQPISNIARMLTDQTPIFYGTHVITEVPDQNSFSYSLVSNDIAVDLVSGSASGYYYDGSTSANQYSALFDTNAISIQSLVQISSTNRKLSDFLKIFESNVVDLL